MAVADGHAIQTLNVEDPNEMIGINTRLHLAQAEALTAPAHQSAVDAGRGDHD